ncbi:unnamed protein product [Microthlaspi erraticum]|uniref:Uncharacterized protein n=1 Tax=Microthlaspi erraticum TaxID=1685480 RepID=A0A6D2IRX3_9BRAS|nr:unnamed protein product [Microthlaspi erraticum]
MSDEDSFQDFSSGCLPREGVNLWTEERLGWRYEGDEANNHTALPCPGELLVEQHHSNYGDVFEFLAESANPKPNFRVLEIGCGTLRVGLHFIRYLNPTHFHCLEKDELSLMAALRYELNFVLYQINHYFNLVCLWLERR